MRIFGVKWTIFFQNMRFFLERRLIMIISIVTDDRAIFIVFVLPEEVKVYTLFEEKAS